MNARTKISRKRITAAGRAGGRCGAFNRRKAEDGAVLIIVMVVCIGLVSLALYFGHSTEMAYRGSASDLAGQQAQRAIDGGAQYAEYLMLSATMNSGSGGGVGGTGQGTTTPASTTSGTSSSGSASSSMAYLLPDSSTYQAEAVPVGDAKFWFIGNPETATSGSGGVTSGNLGSNTSVPTFALTDEASKLNLNTASVQMLQNLPNMTPSLAQAIVAWRKSSNSGTSSSSSGSSASSSSSSSATSKGGPFESIYELSQVAQMDGDDPSILYGNDMNLNHVQDSSESQGAGQFTPGIYDYVTVFSREPNTVPGSTQSRINVVTGSAAISSGSGSSSGGGRSQSGNSNSGTSTPTTLTALLTQQLGQNRSQEVMDNINGGGGAQTGGGRGGRAGGGAAGAQPQQQAINSVLAFYIRGKLTSAELDQLTPYLTINTGNYKQGLVNVNTASATVLACVPGITPGLAQQIVSTRQGQSTPYASLAWLVPILGNTVATQAGPYLTTESFQVSADIAAVGPGGLGYRRTQFVIDGSNGTPQIVYRHDMTPFGWALGPAALQSLGNTKTTTP